MAYRIPALLTAVLVALSAVFGTALWASPAARAHSDLVSSTPKSGAVLDALPQSVTLTFNEDIDPKFVQVVVADSEHVARPVQAQTNGATVTAPVPQEVRPGALEVRYRVVSADGHPVSGTLPFSVRTSTTGAPTAPPAPPTAAGSTDEASATSAYALTGVAALLVLGLGGLIVALTRRHR